MTPGLLLAGLSHDSNVKQIEEDQWVDLLASNTPVVGTGRYVCFDYKVPKGQILAVHGLVPYAKERINVAAAAAVNPDESNQFITPQAGNGWFLFEPQINDSSPYPVNTKGAAYRLANGTLNNNDKVSGRGITEISLEPRKDAFAQWFNPLYTFVVDSEQTLRVIFSLLPAATASGLTSGIGSYAISVGATKRVDYAGCYVVGQQMSKQHYAKFIEQERKGGR